MVKKHKYSKELQKLVDEGKVTYKGLGFGKSGKRLKIKNKKSYDVSLDTFRKLGGISKIKFKSPFRKRH